MGRVLKLYDDDCNILSGMMIILVFKYGIYNHHAEIVILYLLQDDYNHSSRAAPYPNKHGEIEWLYP